jgi:Toprim-like
MSTFEIKNVVANISKVPTDWIYKHYYKLFSTDDKSKNIMNQPFDGRIIKVRSLSSRDTTPSLCFYYKDGKYKWKDFSTGNGGDVIDFVMVLYNKHKTEVEEIIISSYEQFLENGGIQTDQPKVDKPNTEYIINVARHNPISLEFWHQFGISIETLNKFGVRKVDNYSIRKDGRIVYSYCGMTFGYYNIEKHPYQIYNPNNSSVAKYITLDPKYLIGYSQLEFKSDTCIIVSGLKDLMAIYELGLDAEYVAPSSETSLLGPEIIDMLKSHYKNILCIFDNDIAGLKAMRRYTVFYDIPYLKISIGKDLAENAKHHKADFLKIFYAFNINKKINTNE